MNKKTTLFLMIFFSGFASLIYQILWMRQLGFLFGNTSYAVATNLAAFFAGLSVGSWFWGRRSAEMKNPLRRYAWLETGIAVSAITYFLIIHIFQLLYPAIYQNIDSTYILFSIKALLALILIFPASFFMGGTIPVIGQFLITRRELFGTTTARLYGINTIGAAAGSFFTAFVFIVLLGFNLTCACAIAITCSIAAVAFMLSSSRDTRSAQAERTPPLPEKKMTPGKTDIHKEEGNTPNTAYHPPHWIIYAMAFISGFSVLALEVLWTRIFAQIHENSIYSFSSVLIIVLLSLAAGAFMAAILARRTTHPLHILTILTVISGIAICISPFILMKLTGSLRMLATESSFLHYQARVFIIAIATIGPTCLLTGTLFPFLMKSEEHFARCPGRSIGSLSAVNTAGAILGSLICGFVMLKTFGIWRTVQIITAIYLLMGIMLPGAKSIASFAAKVTGILFLILSFSALNPAELPVTGSNPRRARETILETWETSDCTVAVIRDYYGNITIKINSNYGLGSTGAIPHQIFQAHIPLFIFPETKSVFFLGLGTGITAGASLNTTFFKNISRVISCELVPEVVTAAKKYIAGGTGGPDFTNGLFTDPRSEILIEDGRHYLMATDKTFDIINADLFLPYRNGAGSLYSLEHFKRAAERLNPGGTFVQWLPLYQITEYEFGVIAKTMLTAFDQVTLWRNNFEPGSEIAAFAGQRDATPLPPCSINMTREKLLSVAGMEYFDIPQLQLPVNEQSVLLFYCGNLSASKKLFDKYPLNTDDHPIIECVSPLSLRKKTGGMPPQFVGPKFADLVDSLLENCPPRKDPMLSNRSAENRLLPLAGSALHRAWIERAMNNTDYWKYYWDIFIRNWTARK